MFSIKRSWFEPQTVSCHTSCLRLGEYGNLGCLPFTPKNRLIDNCSEWNASNPEWKFPQGFSRSISKTFSRKIGSKAIQGKRPGTVKTTKWNAHSEVPFGNFGVPLKKSRFPEKIPFGKTKLFFPFTFHPKFPDCLG